MNFKILWLLTISCLGFSTCTQAQFTYGEVDFGYRFIKFGEGDGITDDPIINRQVTAGFQAMYRPIRIVGVGVQVTQPVLSFFKWHFEGSPTSSFNTFYDEENEFSSTPKYKPSKYNYTIENQTTVGVFARLFFALDGSYYMDFRYNLYTITESFEFERSGSEARIIDYSYNHKIKSAGLGLGVKSYMGDQLYFRMQYNVDYLNFDESPKFSYNIFYSESSSSKESVQIKSQIQEKELLNQITMGVGYYF